MRVVGDIDRRRQQAGARFKGNQLLLLQQKQRAAQIGRVVRNGDGRAVFQIGDGFYFARVARHREDEGVAHRHQTIVVGFIILFEERAMLKDVGVQIASVSGLIRQQRAAKAHQLDVEAIFLFGHFLRHFRHILFRAVNDADFNVLRIAALLVAARQQQARQHHGGGCP